MYEDVNNNAGKRGIGSTGREQLRETRMLRVSGASQPFCRAVQLGPLVADSASDSALPNFIHFSAESSRNFKGPKSFLASPAYMRWHVRSEPDSDKSLQPPGETL